MIDFSQTERMVACGTLLFLAEVKRIMHLIGEGRRSPIAPRNVRDKKVAQVLQQVGFFTSVRCASNVQPTAADVIHWRSVSGTGADGKKADELVEEIKHLLPARLSSPMYNGLVEAMTNCIHHAYIGERRDGIEYRGMGEWWMFATEQDGRLYVSICDLGIGIPRSLPLTQSKQTILELLARIGRSAGVSHSDSALIGAAIELGRTRTHLEHRGKGFRDMLDVIDTAGSGRMNIHSNHGLFQYQLQEGKKHTSRKNFQQSILGTIIQWAVPVQTERT